MYGVEMHGAYLTLLL